MRKKHRADRILLFCLLAGGLLLGAVLLISGDRGAQVCVRVDGEVVAVYPLNRNGTHEIVGSDGGTNLLVIEDGAAYVSEASCPDKLCVHMGKIQRSGQSIVCLPNRVVVEIVSDEADSETDVLAG